jgi:predicted nucleic acid-binding protein
MLVRSTSRAVTRLAALAAAGDTVAVSDLSRLECRVRPMRLADAAKLADFDTFFARPDVHLVPLTTAVYDRATAIRATHNYKLADSLHLAAAVESGCNVFLTNDVRLAAFPDITVEVLP